MSVRAGRSRLCGGVSSERRVRADCEGEGLVVCVRDVCPEKRLALLTFVSRNYVQDQDHD